MSIVLNVDGGARGNPGPAGAGIVLATEEGQPLFEAAYWLGTQTNNAAEYLALIRGLQSYLERSDEPLAIRSDSELVVKQITGVYRVKNPGLVPLFEQAQMLLLRIRVWKIQHVRRERNQRADELANLAMDQRQDLVLTGEAATAETSESPPPADADSPPDDSPPATEGDEDRLLSVSTERQPDRRACPAPDWCRQPARIGTTLPEGICLYAAHALTPTLVAARNTAAGEFQTIPPLTIRCNHEGCHASFKVAPASE